MGMVAPVYYTADMVRALPEDGNRYEVVYGELLVTPAPRLWHQELAVRLARTVSEYLEREPVGHLLPSPADISWTSDTLVPPNPKLLGCRRRGALGRGLDAGRPISDRGAAAPGVAPRRCPRSAQSRAPRAVPADLTDGASRIWNGVSPLH